MTSGLKGSAYDPWPDTDIRLARWHLLATRGLTSNEIAADLGIKRATLDRMVCRARKRGHPDAILHPNARLSGSGTWHLRGRRRTAQEHR